MMKRVHLAKGEAAARQVPCFSFHWTKDHFNYQTSEFFFSYDNMTKKEKKDYEKLRGYVNSFLPVAHADANGKSLMDSEGKPVTSPRYINIVDMVTSHEPMVVLGN